MAWNLFEVGGVHREVSLKPLFLSSHALKTYGGNLNLIEVTLRFF